MGILKMISQHLYDFVIPSECGGGRETSSLNRLVEALITQNLLKISVCVFFLFKIVSSHL